MTAAVGDHRVAQTVLAIQPTEHEAQTAVEQEASEDDERGTAQENECRGQVTCGKQQ